MLTTMKSFLVGTLWFSSFLLHVQGEDTVDLLTAGNYAILSKAGITNVPESNITGNIAVSPITFASMTGFGLALDSGSSFSTSVQIIGEVFGADYAAPTPSILSTAVLHMEAAYLDAKGRLNPEADRKDLGAGVLDGVVHGGPATPLTPGVYTFAGVVTITNDIYFQGSDTDVFIIQVAGYTTQAANTKVILMGGAKAENIFWQVTGYVTLFTGAHMEGIILCATAVNMNTGSSLNGRILAQTAVALDKVAILEPPPPPAVDLRIRFSKIAFPLDPNLYDSVLPLDPEDYPVRGELANTLKTHSMAPSVMTSGDFGVKNVDLSGYIKAIGGYPSFPSSGSTEFWDEFMEVLDIQEARRSGTVSPADLNMVLPDIWTGKNLDQVAEAVHGEYPASHHVELVKTFLGEGVLIDYKILPFRSKRDFIGLEVRLADMMTWAFAAVAPTNFLMKWSVGRPRPEEIAMQIENDIITAADGVPVGVITAVKAMGLARAEDFTHYSEGSPQHPSWPAMHSASSASSLWLAVVAELTPEQYCQALRTDYAVSFARTVAGVHYTTDNIAGLNLGQKVLADKLAAHLSKKYGADPKAVQEKIDSLSFDWNTFDPVTCTMGDKN